VSVSAAQAAGTKVLHIGRGEFWIETKQFRMIYATDGERRFEEIEGAEMRRS
jgi:hypothetical protein